MADNEKKTAGSEPTTYINEAGKGAAIPAGDEHLYGAYDPGHENFISKVEAQDLQQFQADQKYANDNFSPAEQGLVGAASGLSFGLWPAFLGEYVDPRYKNLYRGMAGNTAYKVGNAAGTIGSFFTGVGEAGAGAEGLGLAARLTPGALISGAGGVAERGVSRLLPEASSLWGKAARGAIEASARGGAEAGLMAMADHVNKGVIYDHPITWQSLASAGVDGALLGALMSAPIGAASPLVKGGSKAISEALSGGANKEAAGVKVFKNMGADVGDMASLQRKFTDSEGAAKAFNEAVLKPTDSAYTGNPAKIAEMTAKAEEMAGVARKTAITTLSKEAPAMVPSREVIASRVLEEVQKPYMGTIEERAVLGRLKQINQNLEPIFRVNTWEKWDQSLDALKKSVGDIGPDAALSKQIDAKVLNVIQSTMAEAVESAAKSMGTKESAMASAWGQAVVNEEAARFFNTIAKKGAYGEAAGAANDMINKADIGLLAGSAAMGNPIGGVGIVGARMISRKMDFLLGNTNAAWKTLMGSSASAAVAGTKEKIGSGMANFFKGGPKAGDIGATAAVATKRAGEKLTPESYSRKLEKAHMLVSPQHQQKVMEYAKKIMASNESLAMQVIETYNRAAEYLRFNLPPSNAVNAGMSLRPEPKDAGITFEGYKFERIFGAIANPTSIVDKLASGEVSRDEVMAVKYVYPELHQEMVESAMEQVQAMKAAGESLSLNKIANLGVALDTPIDSMLETSFVAAVQKSFIPAQPAQEQPPAPQPDQVQATLQSGLLTPIDQALLS